MFSKFFKNKYWLILAVIISVFTSFKIAQAHVLVSDGAIGAVLHIDPEDDPIVLQPATFHFEFKDKQGKFDPTKCTCVLSIVNNGQQLFSTNLFSVSSSNDINAQLFNYTFQQKGVYQVIVKGTPVSGYNFQQFTLKYDVRVARESAASSSTQAPQTAAPNSSHSLHYILFGIGLIIIFFLVLKDRRKTKKHNDKKSNSNTVLKSLLAFLLLSSTLFHTIHSHHFTFGHSNAEPPCCSVQVANVPAAQWVEPIQVVRENIVEKPVVIETFVLTLINNKSPPRLS